MSVHCDNRNIFVKPILALSAADEPRPFRDNGAMVYPWISERLDELGKNQAELARHLGLDPTIVNKLIKGKRNLQVTEIAPLAEFLEWKPDQVILKMRRHTGALSAVSVTPSLDLYGQSRGPLRVIAEVQAGVWVEEHGEDILAPEATTAETIPLMADPRFDRNLRQFAVKARGESMNRLIRDGEYALCIEAQAQRIPIAGEIVVVERTRYDGALRETTLKQVAIENGQYLLYPRSTDPRFQDPIALADPSDEEVSIEIKALVVGKYARLYG